MNERPYSRYTRAQTWAALYSQHVNAGYALVPYSATNNSIDTIWCQTPEEAVKRQQELDKTAQDYQVLYNRPVPRSLPEHVERVRTQKRSAVVLARSSDYYRYHLAEVPDLRRVICGLHDSYLQISCWEMRTNRTYKARETAVALTDPTFDTIRRSQFGHRILLTALHNGDKEALAFLEGLKTRSERSYWRIKAEVDVLQAEHYQGRPLAFLTEAERKEIGQKISTGLKRYHAQKRSNVG